MMRASIPYARLCAAATAVLFATTAGCVRACRNDVPAPVPTATAPSRADGASATDGTSPLLKNGAVLFNFDYESVTEFLIVKADPATGERFAAHLSRPEPRPEHPDEWKITNAGGGADAFLDQQADGYFVLHLLDTLRTLRVEQSAALGPLESLGLAPPRFALQWKSGGKEYEVRIGSLLEDGKSVYAWIPNQPAFVASGATLQMLEYLKTLASLRLKNWAGLQADDVDEIEIPASGGPAFYAQREGSDWNDRKHKHLSLNVDGWLDKLVHERVMEFVDDAAQAKALRAQVERGPARRATLKDRHGHPVELKLAQVQGKWIGLSSARPQGVFVVFPESSQALVPPKRR